MEIQPKQPSIKGPNNWFTGDVWIDGVVRGRDPSLLGVGAVHFTRVPAPPGTLTTEGRPSTSQKVVG
jgi:hypothetical protein